MPLTAVVVPWFRRALAALAAACALLGLVAAPQAQAFGGARLIESQVGLTFNGTAYPRLFCAGGTLGFCSGTITIRRGGRVLGSAPLAVRSGDGPSVQVPLAGGSRTAVLRGGRTVTVTIRTHDNMANWRSYTQVARLKAG
jgi:hypothetical protein